MPFWGGGGGGGPGATIPTVHLWNQEDSVYNYDAAIAEASHVFTFTTPINWENYSALIAILDMQCDVASLELQARINAVATGNYLAWGFRSDGAPALTAIATGNVTQARLATATILGANEEFAGILIIQPDRFSDMYIGHSDIANRDFTQTEKIDFRTNIGGHPTITSLEIRATNNWTADSRIELYRIARTPYESVPA